MKSTELSAGLIIGVLILAACKAFSPDPNAVSGTTAQVLSCEAQARQAYAMCMADAGDADDTQCQKEAIQTYRACKSDAGL